jgi:membrane protease YdiL (CAAX protease family)
MVSGRRLLAVLGAWLLGSLVLAGGTFAAFRISGQGAPDPNRLAPIIVAEVYLVLVAALALVLRPRFREVVALERCSATDIAMTVLLCAGAYAATGAIETLISPRAWSSAIAILKGMGSDDGRLAQAGPTLLFVIVLRACVLAPLGEELLFRGALFTWLRRRLPAGATIAITAAAFASIHGFPAILPLAFALGIAFGWVRERSGSTVPTIVVHAVHNVLMLAASYLLTGWSARLPRWGQ